MEGTFEYKLQRVRPQQFATFEENFVAGANFEVKLDFRYGFNFQNGVFSVEITITFMLDKKVFIKAVMELDFQMIFKENVAEMASIEFPTDYISRVSQIAFDTLRGYIVAKTEGTPLSAVTLALVNCHDVMKDNQPIRFDKC